MALTQSEKAERLHALHERKEVLVLGNCWDRGSARFLEAQGFEALGTTSGGIAFLMGLPDGGTIGREAMLTVIEAIAGRISIPLTVDIENAYGPRPEDVSLTIDGVIDGGAVGCNLEDASGDPDVPLYDLSLAVDRIIAAKETGSRSGIRFFVNARTDVYLAASKVYEDPFSEAIKRLNAYREAGADCLFVPPLGDTESIKRLKREVDGHLSIQAGPSTPRVSELTRLGVARISTATSISRATYALMKQVSTEMLENGTFGFTADGLPYSDLQDVFRT